jgi:hypothetical protein
MKVIFLDFDGVLNNSTSFVYESNRRKKWKEQGVGGPVNETLSNENTSAFQLVLDHYPEVKIVISSTWRELHDLTWLQAKLESYHIDSSRVIGATPKDHRNADRGQEIQWWLDKHPEVTHYIIIDDNDWGIVNAHPPERFVRTDWFLGGFHVGHAEEAVKKLSNENLNKINEANKEKEKDESVPLASPGESTNSGTTEE